jgi:two-component system, chemotaxis family, sensor kinase CheA
LKKIFKIAEENPDMDKRNHNVVLTKISNQMMGLIVDELLREQEIIVKPFSSVLKQSKGFSGVTILGNGQTVPILDIEGVLANL